jgi:hypothetical protein
MDEPSEIHEASGWVLIAAGLVSLAFAPALLLAWPLSMLDRAGLAAVRGACAAMRAARGEQQ